MTDKELRKLSRLELLELLLEAEKQNEKLKEKIEKLKIENQTAQCIENLSNATLQVENALKYANSLTRSLSAVPKESLSSLNEARIKSETGSDREIYIRMLRFFAGNDDKLSVFPSDIENDVRTRIRRIIESKN